uniref:DNA mismatch repair protein MutS core domain-containing protein n=1 Tax=Globodera rostochiensis TaxID=31243 RepID=A0A914IC51_GLORO
MFRKIVKNKISFERFWDVNSWDSLDLIHLDMLSKKGNPNSLFEILNCCLTRGGTRTLRSFLLQPSASVEIINTRLDIVQELVKNQAVMCDRIRSILSNLHDLQQLISLCTFINVEQNASREDSKRMIRNKIIQVIELKRLLDAIKQLSEVIGRSKFSFFIQTKSRLDDCRLQAIAEFVNDKISPELTTRKRKGLVAASSKDQILFAVAESQHVLLDLARRTYQELVARIVEFGAVEINDIPGAQLCYSQSRGYHFSLHANDPYSINLPQQCIQVVFNKASLTFTTRDLIKYNDRLLQSENEILQKSNLVLDQLIASIREYIPALYKCAELVSLFDYYAALARTTITLHCRWTRPNRGSNSANWCYALCYQHGICCSPTSVPGDDQRAQYFAQVMDELRPTIPTKFWA